MADSAAFEWACDTLERTSSLSRLEARGTVRLILKEAGLASASVKPGDLRVAVERLMPAALASRGIDDADRVCGELCSGLAVLPAAAGGGAEAPEAIFSRLAG